MKQWPDVGRPTTIAYLHRHFAFARNAPDTLSADDWANVIARFNELNDHSKHVIAEICWLDGHRYRPVPHLGRIVCLLCGRYG